MASKLNTVIFNIKEHILSTKSWKNLLVYYIHDKELEASSIQLKGNLLDIGCGTKPYAELLKPFVEKHIGVDHGATFHDQSNIDLFGTAYEIPVEDESFDSAICTAVLEHLEEPRDFYRFTKYGLDHLFTKVGFKVVELKALSGFWVTFGQLFVYNLYRFNRGPLRYIPIIPVVGLIIQGLSYLLDKVDKSEQWTWMYMIVVKKP